MLVEDVCKKCWKKYLANKGVGAGWLAINGFGGVTKGNLLYREGKMYCPEELIRPKVSGPIPVDGIAPPWCPFKFEHSVAVGMSGRKPTCMYEGVQSSRTASKKS